MYQAGNAACNQLCVLSARNTCTSRSRRGAFALQHGSAPSAGSSLSRARYSRTVVAESAPKFRICADEHRKMSTSRTVFASFRLSGL